MYGSWIMNIPSTLSFNQNLSNNIVVTNASTGTEEVEMLVKYRDTSSIFAPQHFR